MLNIWGVILYLRLPWITAQAGIGTSNEIFFLLQACYFGFRFVVFSPNSPSFRYDLGDYPIILLYYWDHWPFNVSHCNQRKGQRRYKQTYKQLIRDYLLSNITLKHFDAEFSHVNNSTGSFLNKNILFFNQVGPIS